MVEPVRRGRRAAPSRRRAPASMRDDDAPTQLDARARRGRRRGRAVPRSRRRAPRGARCCPSTSPSPSCSADPRSAVPEARPVGCCRSVSSTIPSTRTSTPSTIDLEEGGGLHRVRLRWLGSNDAAAHHRRHRGTARRRPTTWSIFGLDFASRALRSIEPLPHVAAVGTGDDLESVTRIIALLDRRDRATQGRPGRAPGRDADRLPRARRAAAPGAAPRRRLPEPRRGVQRGGGVTATRWTSGSRCSTGVDPRRTPGRRPRRADRRSAGQRQRARPVRHRQPDRPAPVRGGRLRRPRRPDGPGPGPRPAPGRGLWQADQLVQFAMRVRRARRCVAGRGHRRGSRRLRPAGARPAGHPHRTAARAGRAHRRAAPSRRAST